VTVVVVVVVVVVVAFASDPTYARTEMTTRDVNPVYTELVI